MKNNAIVDPIRAWSEPTTNGDIASGATSGMPEPLEQLDERLGNLGASVRRS